MDRVLGSRRRSRGCSEDECKRKTDFRIGNHVRILLRCRDLISRISEPFGADLRAPNGKVISGRVCRGDCETTNLIPGRRHLHLHIPSNGFYRSRGNKIPRAPIQCSWGVNPPELPGHGARRVPSISALYERHTESLCRETPLVEHPRITTDPLAQGWTEQDILAAYPHLARQDILACFAYAQDLVSSEKVYPPLQRDALPCRR
jgi:hypothetical protein